ncbi:MAG TPA: hypothetical protein PKE39_08930 [Ignavibacteria bacterium]|nr:hypothetical protein [Ignavibacteria bacterium]HMQ99133.1 hypothetical protein [Ignavibacteria bacterium]
MPAKKTNTSKSKKSSGTTSKKSSSAGNRHKGAEKRKTELPAKRKRQYKHILESERKEGKPEKTAKRIAMATVNKTRRKKGEVKSKRK